MFRKKRNRALLILEERAALLNNALVSKGANRLTAVEYQRLEGLDNLLADHVIDVLVLLLEYNLLTKNMRTRVFDFPAILHLILRPRESDENGNFLSQRLELISFLVDEDCLLCDDCDLGIAEALLRVLLDQEVAYENLGVMVTQLADLKDYGYLNDTLKHEMIAAPENAKEIYVQAVLAGHRRMLQDEGITLGKNQDLARFDPLDEDGTQLDTRVDMMIALQRVEALTSEMLAAIFADPPFNDAILELFFTNAMLEAHVKLLENAHISDLNVDEKKQLRKMGSDFKGESASLGNLGTAVTDMLIGLHRGNKLTAQMRQAILAVKNVRGLNAVMASLQQSQEGSPVGFFSRVFFLSPAPSASPATQKLPSLSK